MEILYVHCGTNKTGTSALQFTLSNNVIPNINYLKKGRDPLYGTAHHPVALNLRKNIFDVELLKDLVPGVKNIISSERFFELSDENWAYFKSCMPDGWMIVPILYFRHPIPYMISWYQQNIEMGKIANFQKWADLVRYDYQTVLNRILKVNDESIIKVYERDKLNGKDICIDFFSSIGISYSHNNLAQNNPSINGDSLKLLCGLIEASEKFNLDKDGITKAIRILARKRNDIGNMQLVERDLDFLLSSQANNIKTYLGFGGSNLPLDKYKDSAAVEPLGKEIYYALSGKKILRPAAFAQALNLWMKSVD